MSPTAQTTTIGDRLQQPDHTSRLTDLSQVFNQGWAGAVASVASFICDTEFCQVTAETTALMSKPNHNYSTLQGFSLTQPLQVHTHSPVDCICRLLVLNITVK